MADEEKVAAKREAEEAADEPAAKRAKEEHADEEGMQQEGGEGGADADAEKEGEAEEDAGEGEAEAGAAEEEEEEQPQDAAAKAPAEPVKLGYKTFRVGYEARSYFAEILKNYTVDQSLNEVRASILFQPSTAVAPPTMACPCRTDSTG